MLRREIEAVARREGISLNKAALRLLGRAAGLGRREDADRIGDSLDLWIGTWSQQEADALLESIHCCEQIDRELWD